jgi:predicted permease
VQLTRFAQDIRFALRALRRRPLFATVAIVTIALGIGSATSIYSVVDGVLLRPLPFREPDRLVGVWQMLPEWRADPILRAHWDRIPLSHPEYRDLRDRARTLDGIAIWWRGSARLEAGERVEVVTTLHASASLLGLLGVRPRLGRMFLPGEDLPGAPGVALLSHEEWSRSFGADPEVLGRTVRLDERSWTIVGVLPARFSVGRTRERDGAPPAFWLPAGQTAGSDFELRGNHRYTAVARLAPGVTLAHARDEVAAILRAATHQPSEGSRLVAWSADQTRDARGPLFVLLGAVGVLLLVACTNVATLLLGEASVREHEMATRLALGAGRERIAGQLLTESLVLAAVGGALGLAIAWAGTRALVALAPPDVAGLGGVRMDGRVLGFAIAAVLATGLLFGLAPALAASRADPGVVLHRSGWHNTRGRGALQRAFVAAEVALSVVLLVGAVLLLRSLDRVTAVDPGFRPDGLLVLETSLPHTLSGDGEAPRRIYEEAVARLAALPGVRAATAGTRPPFAGRPGVSGLQIEGEPASPGTDAPLHETEHRTVAPGYFATLGVPLLAGRDFREADRAGAPSVAVVSATLARRYFPDGSPVGRRVRILGESRTIVGVVGDVRHERLTSGAEPVLYMPLGQRDVWTLTLVVRAARGRPSDAAELAYSARRALADVDPRLVVTTATTMDVLLRRSFAEERYRTTLLSLFGALAALLAAVGTYGVSSRAVARRARETGIRLALGATPAAVVRQLVGGTLSGVALGVVAGLVGAAVATRALTPFLFGVRATDPATYVGVVTLLALVSMGASWLPARRAGRVAVVPMLRAE